MYEVVVIESLEDREKFLEIVKSRITHCNKDYLSYINNKDYNCFIVLDSSKEIIISSRKQLEVSGNNVCEFYYITFQDFLKNQELNDSKYVC